MPINQLYDTWKRRIMELGLGQRITQIRAFGWLAIGIGLTFGMFEQNCLQDTWRSETDQCNAATESTVG